jgi:dihydrofolate reductase
MRKLKVSLELALNGVVEEPHTWGSPPRDGREAQDAMGSTDTLLLGRRTYQLFASYWPTEAAAGSGFAAFLNGVRKYVVSTTLSEAGWNNTTIINSDPVGAVRALKQQPGGDILVLGSPTLVESLARAGLVDEYQVWLHPLTAPPGKRLFDDGLVEKLRLVSSRALPSGTIHSVYQPAGKPAEAVR